MISYKIEKIYKGKYFAQVRQDNIIRSSFYGDNIKSMQKAVKIIWIRLKKHNYN